MSRLLVSEPDFETVAQCGTPAEALAVLAHSPVDIVLLDFDLEDDTGTRFISAARAAGYRGKILMVTAGMSAAGFFARVGARHLGDFSETQFAGDTAAGDPNRRIGRCLDRSERSRSGIVHIRAAAPPRLPVRV